MIAELRPSIRRLMILAALHAVCSAKPCCQSDTNKQPEWTTTINWSAPAAQKDCAWEKPQSGQVVFTRAERAVVAIHVGCFRIALSQFDPERYLAAHTLDALYAIDTRTGNIIKNLILNDVSEKRERNLEMQLVALTDHRVLLRSDFALKLLTDDFHEMFSRNLIVEQEQWEHWKGVASADGSTVMLRRWGVGETNRGLSEDHWISTETLQDLLVDDPKPYRSMLFTIDHEGVYFNIKGVVGMYGKTNDPVAFRAKGQARHRALCADCTGIAWAVSNNGLLFLDPGPHVDFMLLRNGDVCYRGQYGSRTDHIYAAAVAANSNRFAFDFSHGRAGWFARSADIGGIIVFDADEMKAVLFVKEKVYPEKEGPLETWVAPTIALSPDGTQVLVLNGQVLKSFRVGKT